MTNQQTIVSTPGKVLITGGYLVLENKPGLVLSLDSTFQIQINDSDNDDRNIRIKSPQFENGYWIIDGNGQLMYFIIIKHKIRIPQQIYSGFGTIFNILDQATNFQL